jgi:type II secretory pathway component PulC
LSYRYFGRKRPFKGPKYIIRNNRKPLTKMSEPEKLSLATSLIVKANAILGSVDLAWINDKGKLSEFTDLRLQLGKIAQSLNQLSITTASEVKKEGE